MSGDCSHRVLRGRGNRPVGPGPNKGGRVFNLLRDDLGKRNDAAAA